MADVRPSIVKVGFVWHNGHSPDTLLASACVQDTNFNRIHTAKVVS